MIYTSDISYSIIKILLDSHRIGRILAGQALNAVTAALAPDSCCKNPADLILKPYNFQENSFVYSIRDAIASYNRNSKGYKNTLIKIQSLLTEYYASPCCFSSNLEITSNHPAILSANRGTQGYASIESGGDTTDFTYSTTGICYPFDITLSFNFGGGDIVYETTTVSSSDSFTATISDLMNSFLGKQVNINGTPRTIVANNIVPTGSEYNLHTLNGRSPIATVKVTNCLGEETSSTYEVEFEMKRVSHMLAFKRQLGVVTTNCACSETLVNLYTDRRGGGNFQAASPSTLLGDTIPTCNIDGQNVFTTLFSGNANAKWRFSDVYTTLNGFHTNILFRSPDLQVVDALVTSGPASDVGCIFTCLVVNTDLRDDDTLTFIPAVHFSSTTCPTEPFTFGSLFNYNVSASIYRYNKPLVQVGDVILLGSDSATVQNVTTPAALGW